VCSATSRPFGPPALAAALASLEPGYPRAAIALALSGGADSGALAAAAAALRLPGLRALHVNHGLGPHARELEAAAHAQCARLGIALRVIRVTVDRAPAGLEAGAREARYAALAGELAPGELLLAAHHLEDQAETLLLQLLRGAGLKGASAMPARAALGGGWLLRPLLGESRERLRAYARAEGIPWREDPMNEARELDRAYLRTELWPRVLERWPGAARTLARAAGHFAEAERLLELESRRDLTPIAGPGGLSVVGLRALSPERRRRALRLYLGALGLPPPPASRLRSFDALLAARADRNPHLAWTGAELHRYRGELLAFAPLPAAPEVPVLLDRGVPAAWGGLGHIEIAAGPDGSPGIDGACLPLRLARRRGGERLRLTATGSRRAVKDLLREAALPPWLRERLPLLYQGERCVGLVTPRGPWLDLEVRRERGLVLAWRNAPAAFSAFERG
jgi:tRNA(Ile)-lysidine synthase